MTVGDARPLPQPREPAVVVMPCAPHRHSQTVRYIAKREVLETRQLERRALALGKLSQARSQDPAAFLAGQARQMLMDFFGDLDRFATIGSPAPKRDLAAQRPPVRVLKQPAPD